MRNSGPPHVNEDDRYADRVRDDAYLSLAALLCAGAYAWQVHGFWIGLAVLVGLWLAISATNLFVMARMREEVDAGRAFKKMRRLKWAWIALAYILIGLSGAEIVSLR